MCQLLYLFFFQLNWIMYIFHFFEYHLLPQSTFVLFLYFFSLQDVRLVSGPRVLSADALHVLLPLLVGVALLALLVLLAPGRA